MIGDENNKTSPGEVICIKKSKHKGMFKEEDIKEILSSTFDDYLVDDLGAFVFAPKVYDMAVNLNSSSIYHDKGYIMMEVIP